MSEIEYPVIEIFSSIQGEGMHAGLAANFIRLAGCNLNCSWCDTKEALQVSEAVQMTGDAIAERLALPKLVVITGGEPTLYDLGPLVEILHKRDKYVAIETNGTRAIPDSWKIDWITASPKPLSNYKLLCRADELKYVVDELFAVDRIHSQAVPRGRIFLQVEGGQTESAQKAYRLVMKHPELELRLGIQLHKIINVQ